MRPFIDLVEGLAVDHAELDSPDLTGMVPIADIAEMFKTDNPLIFTLALRKILSNRSELLNDFEILECTKAFINFIGMTTEEGVRIAMRLGVISLAHHEGAKSPTELDSSDFSQLETDVEDAVDEVEDELQAPEEPLDLDDPKTR